jgi:HlyD family secretion protein
VGQPAEIVLRSLPGRRFQGRIDRIEIESDRVNEERRVNVIFDQIPQDYHLGEQAEVYIATMKLPQALLMPEASIEDLKSDRGTVWTVEDGQLARRKVTLGHRMLDGRIEILGGIPDGVHVLARLPTGLRVGRAAVITEGSRQ